MRPRRIARRLIARARHWGKPHVHCPSCGADNPVPDSVRAETCFTCKIEWFRHDLTGEDAADWASLQARLQDGAGWLVTWRPLLVDVPRSDGGKTVKTLDCAFAYRPETLP